MPAKIESKSSHPSRDVDFNRILEVFVVVRVAQVVNQWLRSSVFYIARQYTFELN